MFRCEDLEHYVKEVDVNKCNLLILNKADFLTKSQRRSWAKHFDACQIRVIFFSATLSAEDVIPEENEDEEQVVEHYLLAVLHSSSDNLIKRNSLILHLAGWASVQMCNLIDLHFLMR